MNDILSGKNETYKRYENLFKKIIEKDSMHTKIVFIYIFIISNF